MGVQGNEMRKVGYMRLFHTIATLSIMIIDINCSLHNTWVAINV